MVGHYTAEEDLRRRQEISLAEQVREWEQDELRKIEHERKQSSMVAGEDGVQHHLDHLSRRTWRQDAEENDQVDRAWGMGDRIDQNDQEDQVLRVVDQIRRNGQDSSKFP
jgi:hypothetical protein